MGLGLGGEVGLGGLFQQLPLAGLALVGGMDARQGGGPELDHIAAGHLQAQLVEQAGIVGQELRVVGQEAAHGGRLQRSFLDPALRTVHALILKLQDGLPGLGPVRHELIKAPFG